jgi:hypothetical protein
MELLLVHDATQPEICNKQICIVFWCSEEQVLRLKVTVDDAVIVQVCDGG